MDVNTLEATLKNQQWVGGQAPTAADKDAYEALKDGAHPFKTVDSSLRADTHPHAFAWFCLVSKFSDAIKGSWAAGAAAKGGKKGGKKDAKPTKKADDDDMDLFGDDNEEDVAAAEAAKAAAKGAKKVKKVVIAQSLVLFEVKPLDDQVDLDVLAKRILDIKMDGLYWKTEYRKEPVAFGIFKIVIGVTVEDEKVSVDGLQEKIEELDDMVQSVEILAFNKI